MVNRGELKAKARESIKGNILAFFGLTVIVSAIYVVLSFTYVGTLVVAGPLELGMTLFILEVVRTKKGNFATGFNGFIQFVPSFVAGLLMSIFVMLWSLLLVIPGIVAGLSYSMTYFILADNPKISGLEAIKKSKEMMKGHKWEYFCLCFSFFWWFVLCAVTFGLAYIYVAPYFNATIANYYEEIKASSEQVNSVNPSVVSE
ncbi:MAG: DUF975 family protein [Treponema sp.]|nr:DUF975 family protein [Treponema sp.]